MSVSIFGVCSDLGSDLHGSSRGARLLLPPTSTFLCTKPNAKQVRASHIDVDPIIQKQHDEVAKHVKLLLLKKHKPLMIGGDHSFSYPVIQTLLCNYPNIHLLHFDFHSDDIKTRINTFGQNLDKTPRHGNFLYTLKKKYVKQLLVTYVGVGQRPQLYGNIAEITHNICVKNNENIYVSIDVDCLVAEEMTSTGYPHKPDDGGLRCQDVLDFLIELKNRQVNMIGGDLMEFGRVEENPDDLFRAKSLVSALETLLS